MFTWFLYYLHLVRGLRKGSDTIFLSSVLLTAGKMQLLKLNILNCNLDSDKSQETIHGVMSRHRKLLILAGLLIDTMSVALLVQVFISCATICFMGKQYDS